MNLAQRGEDLGKIVDDIGLGFHLLYAGCQLFPPHLEVVDGGHGGVLAALQRGGNALVHLHQQDAGTLVWEGHEMFCAEVGIGSCTNIIGQSLLIIPG